MELIKLTTKSTINLSQLPEELQKLCQDIYTCGVVMHPNYWDIYSGVELPLYYDAKTNNIFVIIVPNKIINIVSVIKQPNDTYAPNHAYPYMGTDYYSSLQLIVNDLENDNKETNDDKEHDYIVETLLRRSKRCDDIYKVIKLLRDESAIIAGELFQYGWDKDTAINKINDRAFRILKDIGDFKYLTDVDLYHLSAAQMKELGFYPYKVDNDINHMLYLFPIWLLPVLDEEMQVTTITGSIKRIKDCDNDNRMGCLSYGLIRLV